MKNLNIISGFLVLLLLGGLFSCSDDFFDVNESETKPSNMSLPPQQRLMATIDNTTGFGQSRLSREGTVLSYHITERTTYYSRWRWGTVSYAAEQYLYTNALPNTADLIVLGEKYNSPHYSAVGKILRAYLFSMVSDQLGDIIMEDSYNAKDQLILTPKLTSQKDAYAGMHKLIDEALLDFDKPNEIDLNVIGTDVMFQGDITKWKKFAWALKARLLNHMTAKTSGDFKYDPAAVIAACGKAMSSNADNAKREFTGEETQNNIYPWSDTEGGEVEGAFDSRADNWSKFFVDNLKDPLLLNNESVPDPRLPLIVQPALDAELYGLTGLDMYQGVPMGTYRENGFNGVKETVNFVAGDINPFTGEPFEEDITIVMDSTEYFSRGHQYGKPNGLFYTSPDSDWYLITYAECKFIEAEANFRNGDKAAAFAAYKEGINADMTNMGVDAAEIANYMTQVDNIGSANITLERIMTQKHIATVMNPETWVDLRRVEYDNTFTRLKRPQNLNASIFPTSGDEVDGKEVWIRALKYDNRNIERNSANLPDNDDASRFPTRVWWNTPDADDVVDLTK